MGRYRIRVNQNLDPSYTLSDWTRVNQFLESDTKKILEIGSGLGEFLVQLAENKPGYRLLGLEAQKLRVLKASEKAWIKQLEHIRFFYEWVGPDLWQKLEKHRFSEIHIHHPDPWYKRRQRHRRIIRHEMLEVFRKLMCADGILWVSTDDQQYAHEIHEILNNNDFFKIGEYDLATREKLSEDILPKTKFEEKLELKGYPSYFFKAYLL